MSAFQKKLLNLQRQILGREADTVRAFLNVRFWDQLDCTLPTDGGAILEQQL